MHEQTVWTVVAIRILLYFRLGQGSIVDLKLLDQSVYCMNAIQQTYLVECANHGRIIRGESSLPNYVSIEIDGSLAASKRHSNICPSAHAHLICTRFNLCI